MPDEDRSIGQEYGSRSTGDRLVGLEHHMDVLREEFICVQNDGHLSAAERNAALASLRTEIQQTFAGLHSAMR